MELLVIFASFFVAQIAQRIIVPILVQILGERRFASPSAFDGCTLGIAGAVVAGLGVTLLNVVAKTAAKYHKPPPFSVWWILVVVAVGITLYGLLFLWVLGLGGKAKEWKIVDGRILNKDGQQLHPTFVRERIDYSQTDAFNGYSHYFLELHSDSESLGTNTYNSKDEFKRDVIQVQEVTNIKWLDLIWAWRAEERKWMVAYFPNEWTLILCGRLDRLTEEDRHWWQGYIYPNFADRVGTEVNASDAVQRVERLKESYEAEMQNRNPNITEFPDELQRLLASEGPVIAFDEAGFDQQVDKMREKATTLVHSGDFVELRL